MACILLLRALEEFYALKTFEYDEYAFQNGLQCLGDLLVSCLLLSLVKKCMGWKDLSYFNTAKNRNQAVFCTYHVDPRAADYLTLKPATAFVSITKLATEHEKPNQHPSEAEIL